HIVSSGANEWFDVWCDATCDAVGTPKWQPAHVSLTVMCGDGLYRPLMKYALNPKYTSAAVESCGVSRYGGARGVLFRSNETEALCSPWRELWPVMQIAPAPARTILSCPSGRPGKVSYTRSCAHAGLP